ncbi:hypothetical protein AB0O64_31525 [Streptomyces sp. NPDC088341]
MGHDESDQVLGCPLHGSPGGSTPRAATGLVDALVGPWPAPVSHP